MAAGNDIREASLDDLVLRRLRAAGKASAAGTASAVGSASAIGRADRGQPLPLSAGQQQMWILHLLAPKSPAYLMTWSLRLTGRLDQEAMRGAWERVVERHEILRTRYSADGGQPVQIIDPPRRFDLRVVAAGSERRARQIADWERTRPFDLATEHPVRVTLITVTPDLHLLVVNIHHIASDGVSYQRIAAELETFYADNTAQLPEVTVQYADFASWELAGRTNGRLDSHFDYWRRALADVKEQPLPLDRPRPDRPDPRGGSVEVAIKPETVDGIRALAAEHRASPYMLMLAAYHAMLAHISQSTDVSVGMPVSARSVPALDDMVGYMVNTVVVRSHHAAGSTFADLLTQVRERFLDAMDHRAAPFKWVVDEVHPSRSAGTTNPLFQAGIDMDQIDDGHFRFDGLRVDLIRTPGPQAAKFDLTLHVVESVDDRLFASLEYAAAVINDDTAQAWADGFENLLDAVVRTPDAPLTDLYATLRLATPRAVEAPGTVVEETNVDGVVDRIHRAWCDVLNVDGVGLDDNFFDVNGDSLRAIALAGRLKDDGLDVTATDIFAHQTIAELATLCAAQLAEPTRSAPVKPYALISPADRAVLPLDVVDAYPLAAMQLGMLLEMRARPDVNTYQDSTSYQVRDDGPFDADAFQQAVQLVVNRHEVLRTTFDLNSYSVPLQLVHREATIKVGHANHGTLGPDGWTPKLREHAARERATPMDLACAPLIRVFAHTADNAAEWWITITECHPILEGWSFHTMLMEFLTAYQEIRAGRTPVEPEPVDVRYADYIAAENAVRRSDDDRAFWLDVVKDRVDAVLPSAWQDDRDTPRDRYQHLIDVRDLDADLHRLATETRTSMKAVLLAAHLKVVSMVFGAEDFYTGVVCDARPEVAGAERVLGMYLNTLPFAMPANARTWGELVTAVYDGLTAMWPHRVFPTQVIQQELGGGQRLLDVFFNYLDFHQVDSDLINEDVTYNDNDNEFSLHVFTLPGLVKFNTTNHRLNRAAAVRLASLYRTVLEEMSYGPDGDATAACLPVAEPAAVEPARGTVLEMVRGDADASAVRCGLESLTYGQLDNLAQAVAERLRAAGVGPGSVVGVVPQRDVATPAALLAVWMAGAAWTFFTAQGEYSAVVAATATGVPDVDVPVVVVRDDETAIWQPSGRTAVGPRPDDVAYVSTTGLVCTHRALASAVDSTREALAVEPGSSWLCMASLPSAVTDLLVPLVSGGTVVITTSVLPDVVLEAKRLVETRAVTHLRVTPLVAERLGQLDGVTAIVVDRRTVEIDGVPGLVAVAGEPLGDVRVVDTNLRPVAAGVVGELCLTGPQLYRTGQLARINGGLEHLGSVDEHVRLNGHRVELYRVRELLTTYPSITDSHVVVRELNGKNRLVAYARTDTPLETDAVRRYLTEARVPRRLVPDLVIQVDSWPLSSTGTIDVDRLPAPSDDVAQAHADDRTPWDEQFETLVKETLASVNYTGELTPDVALTDLGLDSFTTVGLLVALETAYDITIPDEIQIVDMFATARALWATVAALRMEVP